MLTAILLCLVCGDAATSTEHWRLFTRSTIKYVHLMHRAYKLDAAKYEYEYKVVSLKMNLQDLQKTIISAKKSPRIQTIISDVSISLSADR